MTENECIEKLEIFPKWNMEDLWLDADDMEVLVSTCIKAIKENKRYRATGTVKECREARKKQKPEIPDIWGDGYDKEGNMVYDMWNCPNCGKSYEIGFDDYKFCPECGPAIDRRDLDKPA